MIQVLCFPKKKVIQVLCFQKKKNNKKKNCLPTYPLFSGHVPWSVLLFLFGLINRGYDINRGHCLRRVVINIRASKNISGLVKVSVTSPAGLMKFFLNVEPWGGSQYTHILIINMYKFIKIRHDIIKQCHGNYKEMRKFNYKLENEIFRNSTLKYLCVLRGCF